MAQKEKGMLSIGALSVATGVPVDTIRSWERRYGYPVAERKPSGHRVYSLATVPRLQLVSRALAQGHRAAEVVAASEAALESLLAAIPLPKDARVEIPLPIQAFDTPSMVAAIRSFDTEQLKRAFTADWARLGPLGFVQQRAAPLLQTVGNAWADGVLEVRHEHFFSACLGDFLRSARAPMDDRASGPMVALATLPDELHGMGLQMSAVVFAAAGWRVLMLGTNTPVDQIAALTKEARLAAVALSCALPRRRRVIEQLRALRRRLPRTVVVVAGGAGAPRTPPAPGIEVLNDFPALERWLNDRAA